MRRSLSCSSTVMAETSRSRSWFRKRWRCKVGYCANFTPIVLVGTKRTVSLWRNPSDSMLDLHLPYILKFLLSCSCRCFYLRGIFSTAVSCLTNTHKPGGFLSFLRPAWIVRDWLFRHLGSPHRGFILLLLSLLLFCVYSEIIPVRQV